MDFNKHLMEQLKNSALNIFSHRQPWLDFPLILKFWISPRQPLKSSALATPKKQQQKNNLIEPFSSFFFISWDCYWPALSISLQQAAWFFYLSPSGTGTVTLHCIDPAVQSAMRTSGKARRLYSYLWGCNSQLYNLLPQPRSKQNWTPGFRAQGV